MGRCARRGALAVVIAVMLVAQPEMLHATEACDWYAMIAMQQVKENLSYRCGYRGKSWSRDINHHLGWCKANGTTKANTLAQRRQWALERCRMEVPALREPRVGSPSAEKLKRAVEG